MALLKVACKQAKCNAIQIVDSQDTVRFVRFDCEVTEANCLTAADFASRLYVLNKPSRKRKAESAATPVSGRCTCNKEYKEKKRLVQCDACHRFCHQQCTHLAGMSLDEMAEIESFVCSACSA